MFKGGGRLCSPAQAGGVDGGGRGVPWDSRRAGYFTACDNPMHQPARWSATSAEQLPQRGRRGRSRLVVSARARAAPRPLRTRAAAGSQPLQGTVHAGSPTGGTSDPGRCRVLPHISSAALRLGTRSHLRELQPSIAEPRNRRPTRSGSPRPCSTPPSRLRQSPMARTVSGRYRSPSEAVRSDARGTIECLITPLATTVTCKGHWNGTTVAS
jgi:hypothetical protein